MTMQTEGRKWLHFESDEETGDHVLLETRIVSMNEVIVTQDEEGLLTVTPVIHKADEVADDEDDDEDETEVIPPKYRLEREAGLFRIIATRDVPQWGVRKGGRGGLVSSDLNLDQRGECWIEEGCRALGYSRVRGDALVGGGTILNDDVEVYGSACVTGGMSTLTGRCQVGGNARLENCTLSTPAPGGYIKVFGETFLRDSIVEVVERGRCVVIMGANVKGARIRNQFEIFSCYTVPNGFLNAFRNVHGNQVFSVGCQERSTPEEMRELAREVNLPPAELLLLDAFLNMAEVSRGLWVPDPKSAEEEVSAAAPVPVGEPTFTDHAAAARSAAERLRSASF